MANAIDNSNLLDYRGDQPADFIPGVNYVYDAAAAQIDVTDASVFPSGQSLRTIHVYVHDKFGGQVNAEIENPDGSDSAGDHTETIDVSSLNRSKPLDITATVVGVDPSGLNNVVADGGAYDIGAAGSLGSWDKQYRGSAGAAL
jgi:hypothetical protein